MTKLCGRRNVVVLLLIAGLTLALTVMDCQCRPQPLPVAGEEGDQDLKLKSELLLELSSRDEIVQMAGYGEDKLSTVLITGVMVCNQVCLPDSNPHHQLPLQSQPMLPISGALVGVTCHVSSRDKKQSPAKAVTDKYGEFIIDLPSHLHALEDMDKACSVRVLQLPKNSPCHQSAFATRPKGIRLSSVGDGIRTYKTERITILHRMADNSEACMKGQEHEQKMSW